jgi:hypothetical protein
MMYRDKRVKEADEELLEDSDYESIISMYASNSLRAELMLGQVKERDCGEGQRDWLFAAARMLSMVDRNHDTEDGTFTYIDEVSYDEDVFLEHANPSALTEEEFVLATEAEREEYNLQLQRIIDDYDEVQHAALERIEEGHNVELETMLDTGYAMLMELMENDDESMW